MIALTTFSVKQQCRRCGCGFPGDTFFCNACEDRHTPFDGDEDQEDLEEYSKSYNHKSKRGLGFERKR